MLEAATFTVGLGLTFNETVFEFTHAPVEPDTVYVILDAGVDTTELPEVLFKSVAGLHEYELAPVADNVADWPTHKEELDAAILTVGFELTFNEITLEFEQVPVVPITVYEILAPELETTDAPVVELKFVAGLQEYVLAPDAVNVAVCPTHIEVLDAETLTVGLGLTFRETVFEFTHAPLAPTTVYVILDAGVDTTEFPEVLFKSVAGLQVYELAPVAVKVDG